MMAASQLCSLSHSKVLFHCSVGSSNACVPCDGFILGLKSQQHLETSRLCQQRLSSSTLRQRAQAMLSKTCMALERLHPLMLDRARLSIGRPG